MTRCVYSSALLPQRRGRAEGLVATAGALMRASREYDFLHRICQAHPCFSSQQRDGRTLPPLSLDAEAVIPVRSQKLSTSSTFARNTCHVCQHQLCDDAIGRTCLALALSLAGEKSRPFVSRRPAGSLVQCDLHVHPSWVITSGGFCEMTSTGWIDSAQ